MRVFFAAFFVKAHTQVEIDIDFEKHSVMLFDVFFQLNNWNECLL